MTNPSHAETAPPPSEDSAPNQTTPRDWLIHGVLLVVTFATCSATGFYLADATGLDLPEDVGLLDLLLHAELWPQAIGYAVCVLAILFTHEMGHYLPARRYGIKVSMPYFIPGVPPFGTFGAFIKMHMARMSSTTLFRIGAGGPFAGFVVAVPVLLVGLWLSEVKPVPEDALTMGDSLVVWGAAYLVHGPIPEGHDVYLHPVGFAGWVGMFVTSFNLFPLGQLDGGHIAYTLWGDRFNRVAVPLLFVLIVMGVCVFPGWLVLALLVTFMEPRHPPIIVGELLTGTERLMGYAGLALFAITFTPRPFSVPTLLTVVLDLM